MKRIFLISAAVAMFAACSPKVSSSNSNTSSSDKPTVDTTAMFASDIKPILEAKCTPCHFPAQGGNKAAFDNLAAASNHISDMLLRVQLKPDEKGYMPFRGKKEALTADEIAKLKAWQAALGK